jgi:DNA-binding transcriptional LysR family regulator
MQINAIKSFLTVYETQNMTKASERLFVTQQCLSRQIKGIEEELGAKLFVRKKAGMMPTEVCKQLHPEFEKMMLIYENARTICSREPIRPVPKMTIALANGMSNYFDFSMLSTLVKSLTGQDILVKELSSAECSKMLLTGECDMAFLLEPFDDTMLEHALVRQDYGYIAVHKNNPLAKQSGPIPLSALDGQKLITGNSENCATEHFWRYCKQTSVFPLCVASVSNATGFVNKLSREDIAVTILGRSIPLVTNPDIVFRKVIDPPLLGKCHCCFRRNSGNAQTLRALMQKIKESYDTDTF